MAGMRIKDIAAEAGVSPATVSRVLNNRPGSMTEATRARVLKVIERTGYRPSNAARSLRAGRTGTIGVVLADIRNPFSSAMLEALSTQAAERDLSLMTAIAGNDPQREAEALRRLSAAGVDGLIVNTCGGAAETLPALPRQPSTVLLDRDVAGSGLPLVTSNNADLVRGLVIELERSGCTRLFMLNEEDDTSAIRRARASAFLAELGRRGLAGEVVALSSDADRAAEQVRALAVGNAAEDADGTRPTGFLAVNGLVFLRLIEAIGTAGLSIPEDARLATFDEYAWNRVLFGGITTAVQDTARIARTALRLLDGIRSEHPDDASGSAALPAARRIEIPGRIIARASTGR